mgnify:CR=1 FL=1
MSTILEVRDLTHVYGAGTPFEHTALRHINFRVEQGEILGIIGHTGSGKSTLIQHLNGLLKPDSGTVFLNGTDIWADKAKIRSVRFHVGLVFQYPEYQLFEETVARDIAFGPKNMGLSPEEIQARVRDAMEFTGLDPSLQEVSPFDLSGGQKRRVAIAGVIAMRPDVLILDEPTAGLDPAGRDDILEHIAQYHKKTGGAVVIVTHSMEDIAKYADRMVVMNQGTVMLEGTPHAVFSHSDDLVSAGLNVPQITRVFSLLRKQGLKLPDSIYTVPQALSAILSYKEEQENA